tara:strand:+ start:111 stop:479 length:369 start_codon:yes stop_codon:yes gene_type:complete
MDNNKISNGKARQTNVVDDPIPGRLPAQSIMINGILHWLGWSITKNYDAFHAKPHPWRYQRESLKDRNLLIGRWGETGTLPAGITIPLFIGYNRTLQLMAITQHKNAGRITRAKNSFNNSMP